MSAMAQESGFYVSGAAGQSRHNITDADLSVGGGPAVNSIDRKDTQYSIAFGYRFSNAVAMEAGYVDFGKTVYSSIFSANGQTPCTNSPGFCPNSNGNDDVNAMHVSVIVGTPLTDAWTLYGRIGIARSETKRVINVATAPVAPVRTSYFSIKETDALLGVGVSYRVAQNLAATLEVQQLQDPKVQAMNLGLRFSF